MPLPLFLDFIFLFADGLTIFIDLFPKPKPHLSVFWTIGRKTKKSVKKSSRYQLKDKAREKWKGFSILTPSHPSFNEGMEYSEGQIVLRPPPCWKDPSSNNCAIKVDTSPAHKQSISQLLGAVIRELAHPEIPFALQFLHLQKLCKGMGWRADPEFHYSVSFSLPPLAPKSICVYC